MIIMFKMWKHSLDKESNSQLAQMWDVDGKWEEYNESAEMQHSYYIRIRILESWMTNGLSMRIILHLTSIMNGSNIWDHTKTMFNTKYQN